MEWVEPNRYYYVEAETTSGPLHLPDGYAPGFPTTDPFYPFQAWHYESINLPQAWKMTMGEKVVFDMPRASVMRSMVLNHVVHHRAQLSVFLRLNDIPVPSIYGPSADEQS